MSEDMVEPSAGWHSYRCPVCGHSDEVETSGDVRSVACSHCGTDLELQVGSADRTTVASRVHVRRRRRR